MGDVLLPKQMLYQAELRPDRPPRTGRAGDGTWDSGLLCRTPSAAHRFPLSIQGGAETIGSAHRHDANISPAVSTFAQYAISGAFRLQFTKNKEHHNPRDI
jgi:hypothetical protein